MEKHRDVLGLMIPFLMPTEAGKEAAQSQDPGIPARSPTEMNRDPCSTTTVAASQRFISRDLESEMQSGLKHRHCSMRHIRELVH